MTEPELKQIEEAHTKPIDESSYEDEIILRFVAEVRRLQKQAWVYQKNQQVLRLLLDYHTMGFTEFCCRHPQYANYDVEALAEEMQSWRVKNEITTPW